MYFVSPFLLRWSQKHFRFSQPPQQNKAFDYREPSERSLMASADKHHADAVDNLQKAKRRYFMERRSLM